MTLLRATAALLLAALLWIPNIHHLFDPPQRSALVDRLAERQLALWNSPEQLDEAFGAMRRANAEWDFMGRTYLVLALANVALAQPARADEAVRVIDGILASTLALEETRGMEHFLMPYAAAKPWVAQPPRSQFIDGEIAAMLGARRLVRDDHPRWAREHRDRARALVARMEASPTLSAESYPDEAWVFCNTVALASLAMLDALDGTDHRPLFARWLATARATLTDPTTGLLVSSHTLAGGVRDGPEGSSIFMVAHALQLIDPSFAEDQYTKARAALRGELFGFGWAREWPALRPGQADIDSGPTVPVVEASAGASGMAVLGAAAFGDEAWLTALLRSLELAAYPIDRGAERHYAASNAVGDAVLLYGLAQGPLWREIERRRAEVRS